MAQIRTELEETRVTITPEVGELIYITDTKKLWVGDGVAIGGIQIGDVTSELTNNLDLNTYDIAGLGDIIIAGDVTAENINAADLTADSIFTKTITAHKISADTEGLAIFSSTNVDITSTNTVPLTVTGIITGGADGQLYVTIRAVKGTTASPITTVAGDNLGGLVIAGYNGTWYQGAGYLGAAWEEEAVLSDELPKSTLTIGVAGGGSILQKATFNSSGVFRSPILNTTIYSADGTAIPSATTSGAGARAFVTDATASTFGTAYTSGGANKVPVYSDGTSWFIG